MTAWRRTIELSIGGEDLAKLVSITRSRTEQASRVERARMLLAYPGRPLVLCGGSCFGGASSDGPALRRAGVGLWPDGGARRSPAAGQGADAHGRGQGMAGFSGLPQGEGPGLSARVVDDAASGSSRARAWTRRRTRLPRQAGSGHGVQDPQ